MRRACPCRCGRTAPAGEKRRWATPECFVKGGRRQQRDVVPRAWRTESGEVGFTR